MGYFYINTKKVTEQVPVMEAVNTGLCRNRQEIEDVKNALAWMREYHNVNRSLIKVIGKIDKGSDKADRLNKRLAEICSKYEATETEICNCRTDKPDDGSTEQGNDDKKSIMERIDEVMDAINGFVNEMESMYDRIITAVQDAIDINGVVAIGISGSIGGAAYISCGAQLVIDMDGNIGIQIIPGTGAEAGVSADATAYVAVYPGMESITDAEGFGTEIGGSFGEGFVGSLAALFAGEGNDAELVGGYIGIGIGGEGTVAEGHVAMSETFPTIPLGNIYTNRMDQITGTWHLVYKTWELLQKTMA